MKRLSEPFGILLIVFAVLLLNTEIDDTKTIEVSHVVDIHKQVAVEEQAEEKTIISEPQFKECCTYNDDGVEKSCFAMRGNDCSYCNKVC
ncbi:hypothetical protein ACFLTH_17990 [Bacteroidota bacterium]